MKEYTENDHKKVKNVMRIIGAILLGAGGFVVVTNFTKFIDDPFENSFFLVPIGVFMIFIGLVLLTSTFQRNINRFYAKENIPVVNEALKEMTPGIGAVAGAIKVGASGDEIIRCKCGEIISDDSKFCRKCGEKLVISCAMCGNENPMDSKFCENCGCELE